jgi:hypothetical protein
MSSLNHLRTAVASSRKRSPQDGDQPLRAIAHFFPIDFSFQVCAPNHPASSISLSSSAMIRYLPATSFIPYLTHFTVLQRRTKKTGLDRSKNAKGPSLPIPTIMTVMEHSKSHREFICTNPSHILSPLSSTKRSQVGPKKLPLFQAKANLREPLPTDRSPARYTVSPRSSFLFYSWA